MSNDKLTEEILAMFENTKMEATQSYLKRGRAFASTPTDEIKAQWIAQLTAMADATPALSRQLYDDLEAELGLRGIEAPVKEVPAVLERLVARSKAQTATWTAEKLEEVEAGIQRELSKVRPSQDEKN
ncbi:hypothetical protein [Bradyrhizobium sp.]|jgi:hypothetical protein|uniref:hypothetical protein n=1 Tax=Bradyrhizobium sp. TaxID=376 RepID=UPI002DDCA45D|nr:hypothetical protein [Bradyrhizobium sp.]HEV2159564.1 hypothetical protein [Bradyrhizobium sp.]